jgi:hypothetical protein
MFKPLADAIQPCIRRAERCKAEGRPDVDCETLARACMDKLDKRMERKIMKELEREDPEAAKGMRAIDAQQACVTPILDCFKRTKDVTACIGKATVCEGNWPPTKLGCCPRDCVESYRQRVESGTDELEAYATVFINRPECFPGVPVPER